MHTKACACGYVDSALIVYNAKISTYRSYKTSCRFNNYLLKSYIILLPIWWKSIKHDNNPLLKYALIIVRFIRL